MGKFIKQNKGFFLLIRVKIDIFLDLIIEKIQTHMIACTRYKPINWILFLRLIFEYYPIFGELLYISLMGNDRFTLNSLQIVA